MEQEVKALFVRASNCTKFWHKSLLGRFLVFQTETDCFMSGSKYSLCVNKFTVLTKCCCVTSRRVLQHNDVDLRLSSEFCAFCEKNYVIVMKQPRWVSTLEINCTKINCQCSWFMYMHICIDTWACVICDQILCFFSKIKG